MGRFSKTSTVYSFHVFHPGPGTELVNAEIACSVWYAGRLYAKYWVNRDKRQKSLSLEIHSLVGSKNQHVIKM